MIKVRCKAAIEKRCGKTYCIHYKSHEKLKWCYHNCIFPDSICIKIPKIKKRLDKKQGK